jgi:alkanesulfonate monooxygenase SsuD/methylene tetrahydromethanopterin reductase-like flavin-dependent oxidoreductase (luciferase family)
MDLGFFAQPVHPKEKDYAQALREDRDTFVLADELGYTEAYIGEHVADLAEPITDSVVWLASLANITRRIRLGSGTVNLPNQHPALVATKVAMLDNLLEGRFNFGIGPGGTQSDWEIFGNTDPAIRRERFSEAIALVLALWEGDGNYDLQGKHWQISTRNSTTGHGFGEVVKPYQRPHPPIVITASEPRSKSAANAGAQGWGLISGPFLMPGVVKTHWTTYCEAARSAGKTPDPRQWRVSRSIFVADDESTAIDYSRGKTSPYRHYYSDLRKKILARGAASFIKADPAMADENVTDDYLLDHLVIAGTPARVVDELITLRDYIGPFQTLLYCGKDWVDPELSRRSMELMAREVMPALNTRLATEDDSRFTSGRAAEPASRS